MQITSSLVFFLLGKRFALRGPAPEGPGLVLLEPRIPEGASAPDAAPGGRGFLFVSDRPELLETAKRNPGGAWLFCGGAAKAAGAEAEGFGENTAFAGSGGSAVEMLEAVFSLFLSLQDWDNRLKDAAFESAGEYGRLFRVAREFFDLPFALVDRNSFSIAWTEDHALGRAEGGEPGAVTKMEGGGENLQEEECHRASDLIEPYLYPQGPALKRWLCCNIYRGSHYEGRIVAEPGAEKNHPGRSRLLAQIAKYIGAVFINSTDHILARRQSDPLHQLVRDSIFAAENVTGHRAQAVLSEIAWKPGDAYFLTVFQIADEFSFTQSSLYICRHLETDVLHSCAITYASQIIWLIDTRDIAETKIRRDWERVVSFIVREFNCRAGLSKPFSGFSGIRNAYIQGTAALRLGCRHDTGSPVYPFADYVVDYILERMTSELPAKDLLHPGAITLRTLDKNEGTGYVKTLRSYVDFQFNMTQAAERLGLHRTTLIRRLEKIGEITGIDFRRPKEMLQMVLSLYLLEENGGAPAQ